MIGHPKLPGGRFREPLDLGVKAKMLRRRTRGTKARMRRKAAMVTVEERLLRLKTEGEMGIKQDFYSNGSMEQHFYRMDSGNGDSGSLFIKFY
jgi:hypothetical protein